MNVYIFAADLYCEKCGDDIRARLDREGKGPNYPDDETTWDSDDYPKGPYPDGGGEADCPCHCGSGDDCLDAIELDDGTKVGAWLENELTTHGVEYTRQAIREGGEVAELWAEWYPEARPEDDDPEDDDLCLD